MKAKSNELLDLHLNGGQSITYNHYFTDNIQKAKDHLVKKDLTERLKESFSNKAPNTPSNPTFALPFINAKVSTLAADVSISDIAKCLTSRREADMGRFACSEVLASTEAFYKVAMKTFVDNAAVQAVEACLESQLPDLLTPTIVLRLDEDSIRGTAEESQEDQKLEKSLSKKEAVLQKGLKTCLRHAGRKPKYSDGSASEIGGRHATIATTPSSLSSISAINPFASLSASPSSISTSSLTIQTETSPNFSA